MRHETTMEVETTYVDSHEQSEIGFAFCHLLGFSLLPRLKHMKRRERRVRRVPESAIGADPGHRLETDRAAVGRDGEVRYRVALRHSGCGDDSAAFHARHDAKALGELGKAVKTAFLCDYLRLESLQREIHEGLHVIETWNGVNDFILYGKGGDFATNRLEEADVSMLCLQLLQVSMVYVNTLMIQRVSGMVA